MNKISDLTESDVLRMFEYLPRSGELLRRGGPHAGRSAGAVHSGKGKSYLRTTINKRGYLVHRLIWLYVHGRWPDEIDHIDGDGLNNRLVNLRECSRYGNCRNTKRSKKNSSGAKGVHWHEVNKVWVVQIRGNGRRYQGSFSDFEEAKRMAADVAKKNFGEFARIE